MILLWGLSGDEPLEAVASELARQRASFFRLDQRRVLELEIELDAAATRGWVGSAEGGVELERISAAYVRVYDARELRCVRDGGAAAIERLDRFESALWAFLELAPSLVLNRPGAMSSNNAKPFQSQLIAAHGFAVPETLITTDSAAAERFWQRHGSVIYKSVSGIRSIVSRLTEADRERLPDLRWCPTQLQAYVPGVDVRVHVAGERLFATSVVSAADDYRYAKRQGMDVELRAIELPDDVAERCRSLSRGLGLPLCGIDLRRAQDGTWYCFEVNPSPGFTYYESHAGQPISRAVAELLQGC